MSSQITFPTATLTILSGTPGGTIKRLAAELIIDPASAGDPTKPARWTVPVAFGLRVWRIMRDCKSPRSKADAALHYLSRLTVFEIDAAHESGNTGLLMIGNRVWQPVNTMKSAEELETEFRRELTRTGIRTGTTTMSATTWGDAWHKLKRDVAALPARATESGAQTKPATAFVPRPPVSTEGHSVLHLIGEHHGSEAPEYFKDKACDETSCCSAEVASPREVRPANL